MWVGSDSRFVDRCIGCQIPCRAGKSKHDAFLFLSEQVKLQRRGKISGTEENIECPSPCCMLVNDHLKAALTTKVTC
jgi:hypothetical protein